MTPVRHAPYLTLLLGALAALPPLAIDMGLPAHGAIAVALGVAEPRIGLTLSLFMVGFACAQLVAGPISDRFGRRPMLLAGTALFALAGLGCAFAASLPGLLALRAVQGAGAGAAVVMVFASVRDLFEGAEARMRLSSVAMVLSIAPVVAPAIGAQVLAGFGWRAVFGVLALAGGGLCLGVGLGFRESHTRRDPTALEPARLKANHLLWLRHRTSPLFALINAFCFGGLFAWVAASPLVLMGIYGVSGTVYGALFAITALGIMAGSATNRMLAKRGVPGAVALRAGLFLSATACCGVLVLTLFGQPPLALLMPLLVANCCSLGLVSSNATAAALQPFGAMAGVAAALGGSIQMLGGAVAGGMSTALIGIVGLPGLGAMMAAASLTALGLRALILRRSPAV
ncbi:DHA1 family bicyclomycin/chloramphenicol resistance-like MFS transporter [Humitalea rosea]|uniref:Bcr/CflA family efflux transporter n=1 Tax=Humitalea rosea TaxID=990373 RepID=A0A2W7IGV8_9PROT|nr:Bcr/CflA family efflux MFS transporter [Humitalea rosea]PZW45904.1 DHA1 family bicyclomycin/chloramphenicol resistance-like MFS transporter [Humitalea rosea]